MKIPELLEHLHQLNSDNEKEADKYLMGIQAFLKESSGKKWTPQHEAVFALLQKRIVDSSFYKKLFMSVSAVLLLAALFFGGRFSFSWEDYMSQSALLQMAKSSTLPLKLEQLDPEKKFLTVKIAEDFADFDEGQRVELTGLVKKFPTLGRHYSLGENARLTPQLLPASRELLVREPAGLTPLGKIDLVESSGAIWPSTGINALLARQQFKLGEPVQYRKDGQPIDFYLAVMGIEKDTWEVRFSENGTLWSRSYYLQKTNRGDIEEPPYLVLEEGWQGMHVVALGIGRYGEEEGEGYAWQVKSFVRTVGFGG